MNYFLFILFMNVFLGAKVVLAQEVIRWDEVKLDPQVLKLKLSNQNCYQSFINFKACTIVFGLFKNHLTPLKSSQKVSQKFLRYFYLRQLEIERSSLEQLRLSRAIDFDQKREELVLKAIKENRLSAAIAEALNVYLQNRFDPHHFIVPTFHHQKKLLDKIDKNIQAYFLESTRLLKLDVKLDVKLDDLIDGEFFTPVIKIHSFYPTAVCSEFLKKYQDLKKNNFFKGLILDLRNNRGGMVDRGKCFLDAFLPSGHKLFYQTSNSLNVFQKVGSTLFGQRWSVSDENNFSDLSTPLVILINDQTISTPELVTGVLQYYERAWVVGVRSYGKGVYQSMTDLSQSDHPDLPELKGYSVMYTKTQGAYYLPDGLTPHLKGILPDFQVGEQKASRLEENPHYIHYLLRHRLLPPQAESEVNRSGKAQLRACVETKLAKHDLAQIKDLQLAWAQSLMSCLP